MKRSFSILAFCMVLAITAQAKCYYCTQTDTNPWGCASTRETQDGDSYVLNCDGPGETVCQFSDGTCPRGINTATIHEYIRAEVGKGNLSGQVVYPLGHYSWTAIDANNFSYVVFED